MRSTAPRRASTAPTSSLIDRLPTELRLQIYDLLFPDKPIPSHPCDPGSFRADAQRTSTKVLLLNRALSAEATAILYARVPFQVKIHPGGIALCGGLALTYPDFDFGKRGGPRKVHPVSRGPCEAVLRHLRRLDVTVVAWVQYSVFDIVRAYVAHFVERLSAGDPPLLDVRLSVEWHNGTMNFPVTHPTPAMARQLLEPFEALRVRRSVDVGNVATPRYFFGAPALAVVEEEEYRALKEEVRAKMLARR
ncbi:hypothetical protein MPH_10482 [Macrophomina phaseolina MS6]|uniref:Uncharacterized protein n=1 Tax=Macrophomina phaseolina (strain MS6) TaxID=1126212 RepID=K2S6F7_MACPH|nr:hypothetical protein MPH_10482 [Macrophomina phaseolina MS6]